MERAVRKASLSSLPTEITLWVLKQLVYDELARLRRVNSQWRDIIDYNFTQADYGSPHFWLDGKLKTHGIPSFRELKVSYHRVQGLRNWAAQIAKSCPRVDTLIIVFKPGQTLSRPAIISNLQAFCRLTVLHLEDLSEYQVYQLVPVLIDFGPNMHYLRIRTISGCTYDDDERDFVPAWLRRNRSLDDMPRLRYLNIESEWTGEGDPWRCCEQTAIETNEKMNSMLRHLIISSKILETLIVQDMPEDAGCNSSFSALISRLHETHNKLRTGAFQNVGIHRTPALAFEDLTLVNCWDDDEMHPGIAPEPDFWEGKLRHFTQKAGTSDYPFCRSLETFEIVELESSNSCCMMEFFWRLRRPLSPAYGPVRSLKSLRLSTHDSFNFDDRGSHHSPELMKRSDLENLVRWFPNLRQLSLLLQDDDVIQHTETAFAEQCLRANLPYLEQLTIAKSETDI